MAGERVTLAIVLKAIDQSTATFRKVNAALVKTGANVAKVGKTMTTKITLPLVAIGAASTKAFADFEKGMSNVSTLIDTDVKSMDAMGASVLAIGRRTPVAVNDLTSALFDVRSAGITAADAMTVLEKSGQLGVAGLGTTAEAADLATSAINAFGIEGAQQAKLFNNLFQATKFGKTTIAGLSKGFGDLAGTAAANGVQLDELLAATAALTGPGLSASKAYTGMRNILNGLTRDTKKSRKVFRALGVKDFEQLIKKSGGFVAAIKEVNRAVGGSRSKLLDLQIGSEGLNTILSITGAQSDTFTKALTAMRGPVGDLEVAFKKQNKTASAGMQRTKNAILSAGVTIGKVLAPVFETIAKKVASAAKWFGTLDEDTRAWVIGAAAFVAAVGPVIFIVGKLTTALSAVATAIGVVTAVIRAAGIVIAANPIGVAVTAMALGAILIIDNWKEIDKFFKTLWEGVLFAFEDASKFVNQFVDDVIFAASKLEGVVGRIGEIAGGSVVASVRAQVEAQGTSARPVLGAPQLGDGAPGANGANGANGTNTVKVEFTNAPAGTRVTQEGNGAGVDLSLGMQL